MWLSSEYLNEPDKRKKLDLFRAEIQEHYIVFDEDRNNAVCDLFTQGLDCWPVKMIQVEDWETNEPGINCSVLIKFENQVFALLDRGDEYITLISHRDAAHLLLESKFTDSIPKELIKYCEARKYSPPDVKPESKYVKVPSWDLVAGILKFKGIVCREVATQASNVRKVLNAFEEDGWPFQIDSPLKENQAIETVVSLNSGLSEEGKKLIKFDKDKSGEYIFWKELPSESFYDVPF